MNRFFVALIATAVLSSATPVIAKEYTFTVPWAERAYKNKDYKKAARGFTKAIEEMEKRGETAKKNFQLREYTLKRAGAYLRIGKQAAAAKDITRLLTNGDIRVYSVWQGHLRVIIDALSYHLKRSSKDLAVLEWRGKAYEASSNYDKAVSDYTRLLKLTKTTEARARALSLRSWPLRLKNKEKAALADLNEAIELEPKPGRYMNRSRVHRELGRLDAAVEDVTSALGMTSQSDKNFAKRLISRAYLYRQAKQPEKALADLGQVLDLNPKNSKAKGIRIVILNEQNKQALARKELLALRRADPRYFARPDAELKPFIERLKAEELAQYLVPKRAGRAWKMAETATVVPLRHMLGKETDRTKKQWAALSRAVKALAKKHSGLSSSDLAPIPDFSRAGNERLKIALTFVANQTKTLADVLGAEDGDPARAVVVLSSLSSHINVLNALRIKGSGKKFSKKFREATEVLALPEDIWGKFLEAAEADDRAQVRARWPLYVKSFGSFMKENAKSSGAKAEASQPRTINRISARHILVNTKSEALSLLSKLKKGADFAKLANRYSIDKGTGKKGGNLGFFGRGEMVKPFEDVAFGLKEGEVSDPFKSKFGWHLVKVDKRRF